MKRLLMFVLVSLLIAGCGFVKPLPGSVSVYFMSSRGLYEVKRTVENKAKIYEDVFRFLIKGPTFVERVIGVSNSVPGNIKFNGAHVKGNILYLDLSKEIELWQGAAADVRSGIAQIVYSYTQFKEVNKVAFVVDGRKKELVLGGEGYMITGPLTRNDVDLK